MLRRLYADQPDSFAFTPANLAWADAQITKYPEGRQASAIIPLLWRAQEQEGWLTRPAIEYVAEKLGMAYIRALEVATFYFMFQLQPVGSVAHIQVCGTTSCMICGAEDLMSVCKEKIAEKPHQLSADGKFSWEEVECLGACANAPMAQIGKDYYEDLTAKSMAQIIDMLDKGEVPTPGSQNGRYAAEPRKGLTSLTEFDSGKTQYNASVQLAADIGDTVKRIDGTEVPLLTPWQHDGKARTGTAKKAKSKVDATKAEVDAKKIARPKVGTVAPEKKTSAKPKAPVKPVAADGKPELLKKARAGGPDDLKMIKGVGPKLEALLHKMGVYHFDQIAGWRKKEVAWADENLEGFKGRVSRDEWVKQAKVLAKGGTTEFSSRVKKGGVY
ncbi:NADH-quinone oxidoreductase subunit E [Litoreibacter albidus]|uniref:NADH dehydrogenase subunit E n=1 Tax=Litoreibacter albidus TaxID=670155 RepID=A0A1H2RWB5_9RHOB|nr:NADH-quinone oxidoreductase subunit E [Litoreibacter albidus]SDW23782.1 NADH dehydrogenase subunit E [Litoreibacter albidus]